MAAKRDSALFAHGATRREEARETRKSCQETV